ncbi:TPA: accessory Sec system protein Asp3 [Streptococcus suis]
MEKKLIDRIYWGDVASHSNYLYGSSIRFVDRSVYFENPYFAAGKAIKTWQSKTNYQAHRVSPSLPILVPGESYTVLKEFSSVPEGTCYLQLRYFNRQGEQIGTEILRDEDDCFVFPEQAYSYSISLMGAGCDHLVFHSLSLYGHTGAGKLQLEDVPSRKYWEKILPDSLYLVKSLIQVANDEGV